ncbi:uroporphyrinogen decarboxylase family protein [Treponema primitia]|uniref:uroporphyrinogen decarboxylase family protein n=1 Tax=Treponema primitia TaxID=88058 RepID=UPI0002555479|nr:uroporphyrinogen decarboxylase family protein [Treponema primitia]
MSTNKQAKEARLRAALSNREGDRVPLSDFFWTGFLQKAREQWGAGLDIYRKFDLDYIVINPNMDPIIQDFEVLEETADLVRLRTGFGATILRKSSAPMPAFESFSVKTPKDMEKYVFEDPKDRRRLYRTGDDQLNGVGDAINRNTPSWNDRVDAYCEDFPVFGSINEGYEELWRCIGSENSLYWMMEEPELFGAFVKRVGDFMVGLTEYQIEESRGRLSGMYIWGDVAYVNGMLFSPEIWREHFKPIVKRLIDVCHKAGLMVIYHGCGNASRIYNDYIEIGLDGYNPVECKAHLDIVDLQKDYGGRLCFVGNIDVRELESGDRNRIKREILYKLQSAVGGGWICQSDHSVSSDVSPDSYAYMTELIRDYGRYPLDMDRIKKEIAGLDKQRG